MIRPGDILGEWTFRSEAGKIREFARAVHDVHDDGAVASPTFPVVASAEFVERLVTEVLKLDRSRTLHGEQTYEYVRPIVAGDELRCTARLVGDETKQGKRGGAMRVLTVAIDFTSVAGGALVCQETMTTIETAAEAS
jgi:N-terminal half of MaoC dehydratase